MKKRPTFGAAVSAATAGKPEVEEWPSLTVRVPAALRFDLRELGLRLSRETGQRVTVAELVIQACEALIARQSKVARNKG